MTARLEAAVAELVDALRAEVQASAAADTPDRLLSIEEARAAMGGISRSLLYDLIGKKRIRSVVAGRRRFVPASAVTEYAAELPGGRAGR
jgi:excisionase family DNA binding protein